MVLDFLNSPKKMYVHHPQDSRAQKALNNLKILIQDDDKFNNLKNALEFEITNDKHIKLMPGSNPSKVCIHAFDLNSIMYAFGYYLRNVAHGHIGWCGNRFPSAWPGIDKTYDVNLNYKYRIAYNYCTLSYTFAFWDKPDWEREIIKLAVLGYNVALVIAGLPKLWQLFLRELGFSDSKIQSFLPDESIMAWFAMGNLQQNETLTMSNQRIDYDADLAKFIVRKMREVGIEPILPGFSGIVPTFLTSKILSDWDVRANDSQFISQGSWSGYTRPSVINPCTTSFKLLARMWYKHLKDVYGINYAYYLGGDLFHEGGRSGDINPIKSGQSVQSEQQRAFPGCRWVVQAWQLGQTQLDMYSGLNPHHTLIEVLTQDMSSSGYKAYNSLSTGNKQFNNSQFPNIPWVIGEVLNFGGKHGLYGGWNFIKGIKNISDKSFSGFAMMSEGQETNPLMSDLFSKLFFSDFSNYEFNDENKNRLIADYCVQRYGSNDSNLIEATLILLNGIYSTTSSQQGTLENLYCAYPNWNLKKTSSWGNTNSFYYNTADIKIVLQKLKTIADQHSELWDLETFQYDIIDIGRQIIQDKSRTLLYNKSSSDFQSLDDLKDEIHTDIVRLDKLLCSSNLWRLDSKENRTISKAGNDGVWGYRKMITTWTRPETNSDLNGYAHRQLGGLMLNYYWKRWEYFLTDSSTSNVNIKQLDKDFPNQVIQYSSNSTSDCIQEILNNY